MAAATHVLRQRDAPSLHSFVQMTTAGAVYESAIFRGLPIKTG
jgi:hypothetical protein